ncbi:MAG: SDR family oxidoreductase [Mediterraneibacter faecis]
MLDDLDITNTEEVLNFGIVNRPDVIINCCGVTDTDLCEKEPEHAYRVNALGARNLSIVARKNGAKIVQLSTDDVFDGQSKKPYTEFDDTNPLTVYGASKRAGENYVKEFTHKHFIIRSNWVYGKGGNNFVNRVLEDSRKGIDAFCCIGSVWFPDKCQRSRKNDPVSDQIRMNMELIM